jgi:hypothetical protein
MFQLPFEIPSLSHQNLLVRPHVAMEGLLTPVSTSYKSTEKPVEDALYV